LGLSGKFVESFLAVAAYNQPPWGGWMKARRQITRRQTLGLLTLALGSSAATACIHGSSANTGNRIVSTPTYSPDNRQLVPRNWNETRIKLGAGFDALATLNSIQSLQLPKLRIPFITSMTFFAAPEVPLVTIGLYYLKNESNRPAKDILTGGTFGLQQISDLDAPLSLDATQVLTVQSENITRDQLDWFEQHRKSIIDSMQSSPEGSVLGKSCECNFTTRARPPVNTASALVITGGNYAGTPVPYTVIGQRVVFVDGAE
jgi:hypothetical protein